MSFTLKLPSRNGEPGTEDLTIEGNSLVIVGANGSGKSRLGYWIEMSAPRETVYHRISAQRILTFPNRLKRESVKNALAHVLYGGASSPRMKSSGRWRNQPTTTELNDIEHIFDLLFATEAKIDHDYKLAAKSRDDKPPIPLSPSDILIEIWKQLLVHRQIRFDFEKTEIEAIPPEQVGYSGREMSDGERVALYLVAQVLCVDAKVFIIDEPEIHLHRAILSPLWDNLEAEKQDSLFVYITHDLEFAASRANARKIWVKEYLKISNHESWYWQDIPTSELPEHILLTILGSPRPILFVESAQGGLDYAIYQAIYPDWLVIPRGSCEAVIQSVKALKKLKELPSLHIQVAGVIDRDFRSDEELQDLEEQGIFCSSLAEIENLLFVPELLKVIPGRLGDDINVTYEQIIDAAFKQLESSLEFQVSRRTAAEIEHLLKNRFEAKQPHVEGVKTALAQLVSSINVDEMGTRNRAIYEEIVRTRDYQRALQVFNHKGIVQSVSQVLQIGKYRDRILSILKSEPAVLESIRHYMPQLPHH